MRVFPLFLAIHFMVTGTFGFQKIECSNYSAPITLIPPIDGPTPLILDFRLLSEEQQFSTFFFCFLTEFLILQLCHSRRIIPKFNKLHIGPASYITTCEQCPQCFFTFPMQFELPLSFTINRLFVITKTQPHHQSATDVPIHYVLVEKLPNRTALRNCRIYVPGVIPPISDNFQIKFLAVFFISAFGVMLLVRCFCIKSR
ncbi:hypothetical protein CAEBREN_13948 [Caenorhabditis brenneri]|uniref:Phosphatidylinositol-glycan biosynthesis class X protein n=1 Tax=Caenorhabditis brenneri TaxID=135651 RepID=G0PA69_CAEBE|nr:hypothetical protein CAEBREN_13948 [Caenorhabditis brenneri]